MKKFLLFVSAVILSLFLFNNKAYAQVNFPDNLIRIPFSDYYFEQTHQYTYEYTVEYILEDYLIFNLDEIDYYFITKDNQYFRKPLDNRFHSYELEDLETWVDYDTRGTLIVLRITVDKRYIDDNYGGPFDYQNILQFFRDDSALYVNYYIPDANSYNRGFNDGREIGYNEGYEDGFYFGEQVGYDNGYSTGYNNGYNNGYNEGYGDGVRVTEPEAYQRGYDDGYNVASNNSLFKFTSNLHIWLVPAIIIVVIAGIFVGYRRERYGGD